MMLDAPLWQVPGMGVHLALGHGVIKPLLGGDWFAVPVVELTVLTVNVEVPACLHVLVNLHGATLLFPGELLGLVGGQCLLERRPMAQILVHKLAATQPFTLRLRLLLDLRHMSALVRDIAAECFGQLLAVAGEDLSIMSSA